MKKINKSSPPNSLTLYESQFPMHDWGKFRDHKGGSSYKTVKQNMLSDQGGLCGYCETKIEAIPEYKQRVEHYHSKSDNADPKTNWALDWQNVFAVCLGGSSLKEEDKKAYPLPINLSCDAYKGHLINKKKLPEACEGYFLNPLRIISTPSLFDFDRSTGALKANKITCRKFADIDNQYASFEELVEKTIEILNLNCQRLLDDRLVVLKAYNQEVAKARKIRDREGFNKLTERWFQKKWPSFFTTRRILLGKHAELYLSQTTYNG